MPFWQDARMSGDADGGQDSGSQGCGTQDTGSQDTGSESGRESGRGSSSRATDDVLDAVGPRLRALRRRRGITLA